MKNKKNNRRPKPDIYINVAPLVEVMLVLIIIFMITAPTMNVGIQVDLPQTKASSMNDSKTQPIIVSIDKNSKIYIEEASITLEDLIQKLPSILKNAKSDTIYVRGDKDLQYGTIMQIMGVISSAGACKVSLISTPENSNLLTSKTKDSALVLSSKDKNNSKISKIQNKSLNKNQDKVQVNKKKIK